MSTTVYSADVDAHRQQFSTIGNLLIAISTLVNETYSPPRSLTKSFFRSARTNEIFFDLEKTEESRLTDDLQCAVGKDLSDVAGAEVSRAVDFDEVDVFFRRFGEIAVRHDFAADEDFSSRMRRIRVAVIAFVPILQPDLARDQRITRSADGHVVF